MNLNIANKYRPKKFSHVIGQESAISSITSSIKSCIIAPAYIAYGLQGCGKTTVARLIAMSLNCKYRNGIEPCGECNSCKGIINGSYEMMVEIDAATNSGVAEMRDLMSSIRYSVPEESYKVIIIDECHSLTKQSWQAALKSIENPPKRVMFVFCTTEYQSVPPTIKSRCVKLQFAGVPDNIIIKSIKSILNAEKVEYEEKALELIAKYAYGSIRDAQSILEGFIRTGKVSIQDVKGVYQTIDTTIIMSYFNAIISKKIKEASKIATNWMRLGCTPEVVTNHLLEYLTNMIMDWNIDDKSIKSIIQNQRDKIGEYKIIMWINSLTEYLQFMRQFPMAYTLAINNITIRLSSFIFSGKAESNKKENEKKIAPSTVETSTVTNEKLDNVLVGKLQNICGGSCYDSLINNQRTTFRHRNGSLIDVVIDESLVNNQYYILMKDVEFAINNYPDGFAKVIKKR